MKRKAPLIAAICCGLCTAASAFTLDFVGYEGSILPPNPLIIPVSGYGDVSFEAISGSLIVDNTFENDSPGQTTSPSLTFDHNDWVKITFLGDTPTDLEFDYVGVGLGELFVTSAGATENEFIVTLAGTSQASNAGIYQIGFNAVPEPGSALLGAIGCAMLVIRRRR